MQLATAVLDPIHHRYSVNGVAVPGVTEILAPLHDFRRVRPEVLAAAAHFGTAVHKACELDDLGLLDEPTMDPSLLGPLTAWRRFCREHGARWRLVEARLYHHQMGYAGTVDRFGCVAGAEAVVDLKTGSTLYPTVGPQLAAYAQAIPQASAVTKRIAVRLQRDGQYQAREYSSPSDWAVFASLLTLRQFCRNHRITPHFQERF